MSTDKNNKATGSEKEKYKYHQSQINEDSDNAEAYPDKPKNHTTTEERLINPDKGE